MESNNSTVKSENTESKAKVESATVAAIVPSTGTIKKVVFWGGIGVAALAVGAGIAYWLRSRNSEVTETAAETAEALRR